MSEPRRILLGTGNPAKQDVLRWMLEGLPLTPTTPSQLNLHTAPDESGDTHENIAKAKALDWSRAGSMLSIASDGGLVVPVLGPRWESRYTHRFAGPDATDAQRLERLLELMKPYRGAQREAAWVEAVAIADRGELLASWELTGATGVIAEDGGAPPPTPGFWVFAIWFIPRLGKTYDRLSPEEREHLGDHWVELRREVQDFFKDRLRQGR